MMTTKIHQTNVVLVDGDITEQATDAIVNPANSGLILGGGVAGAIRRKGGPKIQEECNKIGGTPVGTAVITTGGNLKAKYVIHAVGPQMGEGDENRKLRNATLNSLKIADQHKLKSITFPAISTGIFGYPIDRCAEVMLTATTGYLRGKTGLEKVVFCLWGDEAYDIFEKTLKLMIKGKED
ncbi:macro domain-containing protein [candidate division KSB1 bacterium]|nr:macro domain-containing protein [candidate division KSB1 bacterium]